MLEVRPLLEALLREIDVRPLRRNAVSKQKSSGKFRKNTRRTNPRNLKGLMRGGIRL